MEKKKVNWITIAFIIMIVLFLIILVTLFFGLKEANSCVANPLIYGANKIETADTGDLTCICSFKNPNYARFFFTKNDINIVEKLGN